MQPLDRAWHGLIPSAASALLRIMFLPTATEGFFCREINSLSGEGWPSQKASDTECRPYPPPEYWVGQCCPQQWETIHLSLHISALEVRLAVLEGNLGDQAVPVEAVHLVTPQLHDPCTADIAQLSRLPSLRG